MKRIMMMLVLFLVVGCSKSVSITEQMDQLIESGEYLEALSMLDENEVAAEELENGSYNYDEIKRYYELVDLYEANRIRVMIENYIDSPIIEEVLHNEVIQLLEKSFSTLLENKEVDIASNLFNKLNGDVKEELKHINIKEAVETLEREKREAAQKMESEKKEKYLKLMEEQKYNTITLETVSRSSNQRLENNFYNLASAYDWFINDDHGVPFVFGLESMSESYLSKIKNPFPEVKELMESLESLIYLRKSEDAKGFGVMIGMSEDEVLMSSWGAPESKNVTTSTFGTREQWVYGVGNYLYFRDGILVSIQIRN